VATAARYSGVISGVVTMFLMQPRRTDTLLPFVTSARAYAVFAAAAAEPTSKRVAHKVPFRHHKFIGAIFSAVGQWSNGYRHLTTGTAVT